MALKKSYLSHKAGDEVRWYLNTNGEIKLSNETGILKGWDDQKLEWVIKTKDGEVRADLVCNEADRVRYWEDFRKAYTAGFRDGMAAAREIA